MSPYDQASQFYDSIHLSFANEILDYSKSGYVHITPEYVLMGRRVGNGWYIRMAVGRGMFTRFMAVMPHELPWIGWSRPGKGRIECRWYPAKAVLRLANTYEKFHDKQLEVLPVGPENRVFPPVFSGG